MIPFSILRFLKYSIVGISTFVFDLFLLYLLIDIASLNYLLGAGIAFLIAVSINYFLSRKYVFKGSVRSWESGYGHFIAIALFGLLSVLGGMYVLVSLLGFGYFGSRIFVAGVTGCWSYLLNLFITFKVAGKH